MCDQRTCATNAACSHAEYLQARVEALPWWRWFRRYRLQGEFIQAAAYLHWCAQREGILR